jgi:hypothetical protein
MTSCSERCVCQRWRAAQLMFCVMPDRFPSISPCLTALIRRGLASSLFSPLQQYFHHPGGARVRTGPIRQGLCVALASGAYVERLRFQRSGF